MCSMHTAAADRLAVHRTARQRGGGGARDISPILAGEPPPHTTSHCDCSNFSRMRLQITDADLRPSGAEELELFMSSSESVVVRRGGHGHVVHTRWQAPWCPGRTVGGRGPPDPAALASEEPQLLMRTADGVLPLSPAPQEIDVAVNSASLSSPALRQRLSEWLGERAVAAAHCLRSLRLSGPLLLGTLFSRIAEHSMDFQCLEASPDCVCARCDVMVGPPRECDLRCLPAPPRPAAPRRPSTLLEAATTGSPRRRPPHCPCCPPWSACRYGSAWGRMKGRSSCCPCCCRRRHHRSRRRRPRTPLGWQQAACRPCATSPSSTPSAP